VKRRSLRRWPGGSRCALAGARRPWIACGRGWRACDTSSDLFDEWLERSRTDIAMMVTQTPHGPYPYAGIPWFSAMFGRDGIITALSVLWADPSLARGVLLALAATQATRVDPASDAQPGKILHEARGGEMAALGEIPFAAYYGSVDATPLFVLLAGRYYHRTGDEETIRRLWPHIEAALAWIDRDGDVDGDGFVEYARATERGLQNQGWKDSHDAVFHADGTLAEGPVALCEVQGYVYAAKVHAAELAVALGDERRARELRLDAERLRASFEERFWCDDLGVYALALDGAKAPVPRRVVERGAVPDERHRVARRARRVADCVMRDGMFSGWGVRSLPRRRGPLQPDGVSQRIDLAARHRSSSRWGSTATASSMTWVRIAEGMFAAAQQSELRRLPELFCGFGRHAGESPTRFPRHVRRKPGPPRRRCSSCRRCWASTSTARAAE
jgi:glycogen debranching enzyme